MDDEIRDNPLFSMMLRFKDGSVLQQVFIDPVPQAKAMSALGRMVAEMGGELNLRLPELGLSRREAEVVVLIAQGFSNKEIADALFISERTVKTHISNSIGKVGARNRTHLVTIAKMAGVC